MKHLIKISVMLVALVAAGCSKVDSPQEPEAETGNLHEEPVTKSEYVEITLGNDARTAVDPVNKFSFELFEAAESGSKNIALSPFSIVSQLVMLADGADEESADVISGRLGLPGDGARRLTALNSYVSTLGSALVGVDPSTSYVTDHSVWYDPEQNYVFTQNFQSKIADYFNGEFIAESPAGLSGQKLINNYVESKTNGMICNFLDGPLDGDVALMSVLYFKGIWSSPFNSEFTKIQKFTNYDGSTVKVKTMNQPLNEGLCMESDEFVGIELPFGNGNFCIELIRPKSGSADFTLSYEEWQELHNLQELAGYRLSIPKFNIDYTTGLAQILLQLGINLRSIDLTNMLVNNHPLLLHMQHGSAISIDENGCEGSSATLSGLITYSPGGEGNRLYDIELDSPFMYIVREHSTGAILLMGKVNTL